MPPTGIKMQFFSFSAFKCNVFRCNRLPYILRNLKITIAKFREGFRALFKYPENGGNVPDELKNDNFFHIGRVIAHFKDLGKYNKSLWRKRLENKLQTL